MIHLSILLEKTRNMDVSAKITGIKYSPFLCRKLNIYSLDELDFCLSKSGAFILDIGDNRQIAVSSWISAKRSRSYPNGRVYDCLNFQGKKVTIIPLYKDEGKDGDRDYLQWDTISLMSLLGVYTIITYYNDAEKNLEYENKLTKQRFDINHVKSEIENLLSYQSDALHWNLSRIDNIGKIGQKALEAYMKISRKLNVEMNSTEFAKKRIQMLLGDKSIFMDMSRELAKRAQKSESLTVQPKEKISGQKTTLTIKNYLGGYYYFTCDEVEISEDTICLIESKHSKKTILPSSGDIKEGLVRMILFTNLKEVMVDSKEFSPVAVLKLTTDLHFSLDKLRKSKLDILKLIRKESIENNFQVFINDISLREMDFAD